MSNLRETIGSNALVEAPVVFNPLTARLAEAAGFRAVYLGGGTMGYVQCVTEANLTLTSGGLCLKSHRRARLCVKNEL